MQYNQSHFKITHHVDHQAVEGNARSVDATPVTNTAFAFFHFARLSLLF